MGSQAKNTINRLKKLPDAPGVYFFVRGSKILYIGKATSLRDRVRSYFSGRIEETRGPLIAKMLSEFTDIKFQKTDSVLEALILEANLVKKHKPEGNTDLKDDKSFNYVVITKEDFPRILVMRAREIEKLFFDTSFNNIFGPFPHSGQLKEAMKLVRKIFPFRDRCKVGQGRPCFNRQIGLCPGVCTGEITKSEYRAQIKNITLFFEGKKKTLLKSLEKQMREYAQKREFEKAAEIKKTVFALGHIRDVSLLKENTNSASGTDFRIESYDIAHLSGTNMVGVMTVIENGELKKSDYRKFNIKGQDGADDTKALAEIISRRLNHNEWPLSNLIVVDGGVAQRRIVEKILKEKNINTPVVSVVKDERHKPREILGHKKWLKFEREILLANAEAHRFAIGFHRQKRRKLL